MSSNNLIANRLKNVKNFFIRTINRRAIKIEKRLRLVISSLIMVFLMIFSTSFYFDKAPIFIAVFTIVGFLVSYFALLEEIEDMDWFGLFFLPIVLTVFFYLFYFLFPGRWLTRLPFSIFYGISFYAVLLCSNIFNVGVEKSLQLYRAAFSINYFYLTVVSFLIFNVLFSFKAVFLLNALIVGSSTFFLSIHLFWTIRLKRHLEREVIIKSAFMALILIETTIITSFVPLRTPIVSLFLTTTFYSLGGLVYNQIDGKLFKETTREYIGVWIFVLLITFLSITW